MIDTIYCLKKALHEKLSFLLDIAVKRTIQIIAKMIELINAIVTTVLMKKEPKDLGTSNIVPIYIIEIRPSCDEPNVVRKL